VKLSPVEHALGIRGAARPQITPLGKKRSQDILARLDALTDVEREAIRNEMRQTNA
jgi:hypothetical protein